MELAAEQIGDIFTADTMLPVQFFGRLRTPADTGLRRLLRAILLQGLLDHQQNACATTYRRQRLYREAALWIGEEDGEGPFAFDNLCGELGIHPGALRNRLLAGQARLPVRRWTRKTVSPSDGNIAPRCAGF